MQLYPFLILIAGLVVITVGAEMLLRSASRMAAFLGIKPILIGLTVVSVGTSLPELAVGVTAVWEGSGTLAVGNIAGTNIVNILLILGLSAALRPLPLHAQSIRLDVPVMIATSLVLFFMAIDGVLSQLEGSLLVMAAVMYFVVLVRYSRRAPAAVEAQFAEEFSPPVAVAKTSRLVWLQNIALLVAGMALTIWGADLLVAGAVNVARALHVSDAVIGLTIVAIGTSAPELATTIMATIKNDRDVAVGNLIGSSITNILVILGITCLAAPGGITVSNDILWLDLPLAALVAVVCYPVFRSDRMVSRSEGIGFVVLYLIYLGTLIFFRT